MVRRIKRYERLIREMLTDFVEERANRTDSTYQLITDTEHHHYQVIRNGWDGDKFIHHIVFHLEIKSDSKIWIWVNKTDIAIDEDLMDEGVPAEDIVVGFYPSYLRESAENLTVA
jgi:hypothetical protein